MRSLKGASGKPLLLVQYTALILLCGFLIGSLHGEALPQRVQLTTSFFASVQSVITNVVALTPYSGTGFPEHGFFLPILTTPAFTSYHGFGFGFSVVPVDDSFSFYLCVSSGFGNLAENSSSFETSMIRGRQDVVGLKIGWPAFNSFAFPVWTANPESPLSTFKTALYVVAYSPQMMALELHNVGGSIVWSVRISSGKASGAYMELQDSGNLVIVDSENRTIWQSFLQLSDTLLVNQIFQPGMRLTSKNSLYTLAMETRGLSFYLMNTSEIRAPNHTMANASFWILPTPYDISIQAHIARLEDDGLLHFYNILQVGLVQAINADALECSAVDTINMPPSAPDSHRTPFADWGFCDVPTVCGPMGVCRPNGTPTCKCPASGVASTPLFEAIDPQDVYKGCKSAFSSLSNDCGDEALWDLLALENTATIFQFSGDMLGGIPMTSLQCRRACLPDCSCLGVIYNDDKSLCFRITDQQLSLVQVHASITNLTYTAFLKVARVTQNVTTKPKHSKHKHYLRAVLAMSVTAGVLVVAALAFLGCQRYNQRTEVYNNKRCFTEDKELVQAFPGLPTNFSLKDMHKATQGFTSLIGVGGMGAVYAGVLSDGKRVAVKKLDSILRPGMSKGFLAELATIGSTSHFNIIRLVGFCWQTCAQMLVYEYMEKGSLDSWLFIDNEPSDSTEQMLLDWPTRFKVALGTAKGLAYLHEGCAQPILHLDIKPQNILLDANFEPKLADFGLARFIARDTSHVVTSMRGTPGYIAPEMYWSARGVSKKCDIYSLGVVLLELVGGRKSTIFEIPIPITSKATINSIEVNVATEVQEEDWHFPSWAVKKCGEGKKMDLVDKKLRGVFCEEEASRMIDVALWCIQENPTVRPSATTVVQWLAGSSTVSLAAPPLASIVHFQGWLKSNVFHQLPQISPLPPSSEVNLEGLVQDEKCLTKFQASF